MDGRGHRDEQVPARAPRPRPGTARVLRYMVMMAVARSGQVRPAQAQSKPWQQSDWGPHGAASLFLHRSKQVGMVSCLLLLHQQAGRQGNQHASRPSARQLLVGEIASRWLPATRSISTGGRLELPVNISLHHREIPSSTGEIDDCLTLDSRTESGTLLVGRLVEPWAVREKRRNRPARRNVGRPPSHAS